MRRTSIVTLASAVVFTLGIAIGGARAQITRASEPTVRFFDEAAQQARQSRRVIGKPMTTTDIVQLRTRLATKRDRRLPYAVLLGASPFISPSDRIIAQNFEFENDTQGYGVGESTQCPTGGLATSTGQNDREVLYTPFGPAPSSGGTAESIPVPANAFLTTDNVVVKTAVNGSGSTYRTRLFEIRNTISWNTVFGPPPSAWAASTPTGFQVGSRVGAMVFSSGDCGQTWVYQTFIDPMNPAIDGGEFGPPRSSANEADCPANCFGGFDRPEAYADPFTGDLYLAEGAAGGTSGTTIRKELIFQSIDHGYTWKKILELPQAYEPTYMTSTRDGRLFLFYLDYLTGLPTIRYSLLSSSASAPRFSAPVTVAYAPSIVHDYGADATTTALANLPPAAISRESSMSGSRVRVMYPYLAGAGTSLMLMNVVVPSDTVAPTVSLIDAIFPSPGMSILQGGIIDVDDGLLLGSRLGSGYDTSMLYYLEASCTPAATPIDQYDLCNPGSREDVRFAFLRGASTSVTAPLSLAGGVPRTISPAIRTGDYTYGGAFCNDGTHVDYVVSWSEEHQLGALPSSVRGNMVSVPIAPATCTYEITRPSPPKPPTPPGSPPAHATPVPPGKPCAKIVAEFERLGAERRNHHLSAADEATYESDLRIIESGECPAGAGLPS